MPSISMRQLLEAGVHFGHQTRRWNPKMKPFIFAERNGIHIIDLAQTAKRLEVALDFVRETVARGEVVLFVGTKKQAQEPLAAEATRAGMPYVNKRWLGGMLTNFVTIKKRIGLMDQLEARQQAGDLERLPKKEAAKLTEELTRLQLMLGGIRKMKRLPGAIFIVDPHRERIAVTEANRLEIPVVGTGDTNVDPDELDFIIPANDDAIRAIRLLCSLVADAAIEGAQERASRAIEPEVEVVEEPTYDDVEATDELVAALAGGAALSFAPDDDDDLLPGSPRPAGRAGRRRDARGDRGGARTRGGRGCRGGEQGRDAGLIGAAPNTTSTAGPTPAEHEQEHEHLMADITAEMVRDLRDRTGAGMMDCKRALEEAAGDMDKAIAAAPRAWPGRGREEGRAARPARASSPATSTPAAASAS